MARSIHWQVKFESANKVDCRVDIYQDGYTGSIVQLQGADDVFEYQETTSKDLLEFVRTKTGYLRLVERDYGELDALYPPTLLSRYIKAYYGNACVFSGYIQCQEFDSEFVACPRIVELPVISPLGLAESISFDNPSAEIAVPGFSGLVPDMVSLGALLKRSIKKLGADYTDVFYPGENIHPWDIKMLSTICTPYNSSFKHYMDAEDLFEPENVLYFIQGICAWLGWIVHDTPAALIFTNISSDSIEYSGVPVAELPDGDVDRDPSQILVRTTNNFDEKFTFADNKATQSTCLPVDSIKITSDGNELKQEMHPERSKFNELYIGSQYLGYFASLNLLDPQVSSPDLVTIPDIDSEGTFVIAPDVRDSKDVALYTRYKNKIPANKLLFSMKFAELSKPTADILTLEIKTSYGATLEEVDEHRITIYYTLKQFNHYYDYENQSWVQQPVKNRFDTIKGGEVFGTHAIFFTSPFDIEGETERTLDERFYPIELDIYSSIWEADEMPAGWYRWDLVSLYDIEADGYGFAKEKLFSTEETIKNTYGYGIGEKSIAVSFQNYKMMNNGHSICTDNKISNELPNYAYMFRPQHFFNLLAISRANTPTAGTRLYIDTWQSVGGTSGNWRIIGDNFNLVEDEHTFLFLRRT